MELEKRGRGRPRNPVDPNPPPKRPRGRPKKTELDRLTERAITAYKDVLGDLDPAMSLLPENFTSTTRLTALRNRVVVNRFLTAKRLGLPDIRACALAGISHWAVMEWRNKAEKEIESRDRGNEPDHRMDDAIIFYAAYTSATYAPLAIALDVVKRSIEGDGNVDTARWLIERKMPEEFAPTRRVEVSGRDGAAVDVSHVLSLPEHRLPMLTNGSDTDFLAVADSILVEMDDGRSTTSGE